MERELRGFVGDQLEKSVGEFESLSYLVKVMKSSS